MTSYAAFAASLTFGEVAALSGGALPDGVVDPDRRIDGVAALETAGLTDLAYMDNPKYVAALAGMTSLASRRVLTNGQIGAAATPD